MALVRVVLILNPRSTRADPRALRGVLDVLESTTGAGHVEVAHTTGRGHARDLAAAVRHDEVDAVVVMAGDGTVAEVVDGLLSAGTGEGVPALGLVPAGATNVLARTLGQPLGTLASATLVAQALREGRSRRLGLVHMTVTEPAGHPAVADRWVVLNAGLGLDALAIARVEAARGRGHRATWLRYAASTVKAWIALDRTATPMTLTSPQGSVTRLPMVIVANTDPWSYVGPHRLRPTPQASFDLGIDVSAPRGLEAHQVIDSLGRMLTGRPAGLDRTYTAHDLPWVHVRSTQEVALQADGDYLGRVLGVRMTAVPQALEVLTGR